MRSEDELRQQLKDLSVLFIDPVEKTWVDRVSTGNGLYSVGWTDALKWVLEQGEDNKNV